MGSTNLQRREFLSRFAKTTTQDPFSGDPDPLPKDPAFRKYANQVVPFQAARTQSDLTPYVDAWTEAEVLHLLRRTTFGAPKTTVDTIKAMTLSQAVDYLVDNPVLPSTTPLNSYNNSYADTQ